MKVQNFSLFCALGVVYCGLFLISSGLHDVKRNQFYTHYIFEHKPVINFSSDFSFSKVSIWLFLCDTSKNASHGLNHASWRSIFLQSRRLKRKSKKPLVCSSRCQLPRRLSRARVARYAALLLARCLRPPDSGPTCLLAILLICCGDVETNPGPAIRRICSTCQRPGRRNQLFVSCSFCCHLHHRTCSRITPREFHQYKKGHKWACWKCAVPQFSESFFSKTPSPSNSSFGSSSASVSSFTKKNLSFLSFNARSMISPDKRADILSLIKSEDPDVISVCETWLSPAIQDDEILPDDYVVYRKDRLNSGHGGALIAVKRTLKSSHLSKLDTEAEAVWVSLDTGKEKLLLGSAYRRPKSTEVENKGLQHSLWLASEIQDNFDATLLMGDFNLMIDWGVTPKPLDSVACDFLSSFYDLFLTQLVLQATRIAGGCRSILDLVLCSVPDIVCNLRIIPGVSDHLALTFSVSINPNRPAAPRRQVFNYKRADWSKLNSEFHSRLGLDFSLFSNADEAWQAWKAAFFLCVNSCIPTCFVKNRKHHPWITPDIVKKIKKRNRHFKHCTKRPSVEKWEKYRLMRNSVRRLIRDAYGDFLHSLGLPDNRKKLWAFIRSRLRKFSAPAFLINGTLTSNVQTICEAFSDHFQLNFSAAVKENDILPLPFLSNSDFTDFACCEEEIMANLSAIKIDAATGPDGIPAIVLRTCAKALTPSICSLFNTLLRFGAVPGDWKQANVIPIHKKGDKSDISNYRPISITSLVSKCLERAVCVRLLDHMKSNNFINDNQHGFLPGRSCTTLLANVIDDCFVGLNKKNVKQIDLIALDWAKAFDCIPHDRLFAKLYNYHVRGNVLNWFKSFLSGRTQSVLFGGASSVAMPVSSGVPQGCVTSPLLFTIFMLDLPACVNSPLAQYADDCTIYREISTPEDSAALQSDLMSIEVWCKINQMALNILKCVYLCITRSRCPLPSVYTIHNEAVPQCSSLKLLGITISSDLKWNLHTEAVRCSAMRVLGMLARSFGRRSSASMKVLYTSLVLSVITYGMPAWHPTSASNIEKLERVQGRATRMMMRMKRSDRSIDRASRLQHCRLAAIPSLSRKIDLKFMTNCFAGKCHFNFFNASRITIVARRPGLRGATYNLSYPKSLTDAYLSSLIPRCVNLFNSLPLEVRLGLLPTLSD